MEKRPRLYEKDEQVSDFLYFTTLSLYFGNALTAGGDCNPALLSLCALIGDNPSVSSPEEFPSCITVC